jgi:hypothetical protein
MSEIQYFTERWKCKNREQGKGMAVPILPILCAECPKLLPLTADQATESELPWVCLQPRTANRNRLRINISGND